MKDPLDSVVFIQLKNTAALSGRTFQGFDPDIPLPVRLASEEDTASGDAVLAALSEESILAGILTVFAWDSENPNKEHYRKLAQTLRPNLREELTEAALIKMRNGDANQAEEIFLALKGMNPTDREITLNLALLNDEKARKESEAGKGDYRLFEKEAERLYGESMNMEPPLPEAFFNAGYFYLWQREYTRALEALKTYMALETRTGDTAETRKEKAENLIREIEDHNLCDSFFKSASDAIKNGEEERGLEDIRSFLERWPDVWNAWFLLGWGLRRLERWSEGKSAFLKALELKKKASGRGKKSAGDDETGEGFADICNEIAICAMEENSLEEAKHWLMAALEYEPENTKIISNLGVLAWKDGDFEEAESFFRTAAEINPNDETAAEMLRQLKSL